MSKAQLICPFSKRLCVDCALFRGRHYYLCSARNHGNRASGRSRSSELTHQSRYRNSKIEKPPVIPRSPKWLSNLEDCIERRDG
jgi:hypothetical protein